PPFQEPPWSPSTSTPEPPPGSSPAPPWCCWCPPACPSSTAAWCAPLGERLRDCHVTSLGMASGVVAGLVAITPAADGGLLFGGGFALPAVQVLVALAAMVISGVLTIAIAVLLAVTLGWRIPEADERAGIDISHHAEAGYDPGGALAARRPCRRWPTPCAGTASPGSPSPRPPDSAARA